MNFRNLGYSNGPIGETGSNGNSQRNLLEHSEFDGVPIERSLRQPSSNIENVNIIDADIFPEQVEMGFFTSPRDHKPLYSNPASKKKPNAHSFGKFQSRNLFNSHSPTNLMNSKFSEKHKGAPLRDPTSKQSLEELSRESHYRKNRNQRNIGSQKNNKSENPYISNEKFLKNDSTMPYETPNFEIKSNTYDLKRFKSLDPTQLKHLQHRARVLSKNQHFNAEEAERKNIIENIPRFDSSLFRHELQTNLQGLNAKVIRKTYSSRPDLEKSKSNSGPMGFFKKLEKKGAKASRTKLSNEKSFPKSVRSFKNQHYNEEIDLYTLKKNKRPLWNKEGSAHYYSQQTEEDSKFQDPLGQETIRTEGFLGSGPIPGATHDFETKRNRMRSPSQEEGYDSKNVFNTSELQHHKEGEISDLVNFNSHSLLKSFNSDRKFLQQIGLQTDREEEPVLAFDSQKTDFEYEYSNTGRETELEKQFEYYQKQMQLRKAQKNMKKANPVRSKIRPSKKKLKNLHSLKQQLEKNLTRKQVQTLTSTKKKAVQKVFDLSNRKKSISQKKLTSSGKKHSASNEQSIENLGLAKINIDFIRNKIAVGLKPKSKVPQTTTNRAKQPLTIADFQNFQKKQSMKRNSEKRDSTTNANKPIKSVQKYLLPQERRSISRTSNYARSKRVSSNTSRRTNNSVMRPNSVYTGRHLNTQYDLRSHSLMLNNSSMKYRQKRKTKNLKQYQRKRNGSMAHFENWRRNRSKSTCSRGVSNFNVNASGSGAGRDDVTDDLLELKDELKIAIDTIDNKLVKYFKGE